MSSVSSAASTTDTIAGAAAKATQSTGGVLGASEAQDRFLKLLVTQLKNQDPLNPMDNAQITSQMAQISTVTGIDKLNATLQQLTAGYNSSQSVQATAMIGHSVLVSGATLALANGIAVGGVDLPQAADSVVISVRDAAGQVLHKVDLGAQGAGVLGFEWDGVTDSGASAVPGSYTFQVEAMQGGKKIDAGALERGLVSGVTQGTGGVSLQLAGKGAVALAEVKQVM